VDLDLKKLRYFVAVADTLNFTKAAEVAYIAQPVLSRQIRALERELGVQLFVRSTRSITLTVAGEQLLADARVLLSSAGAAIRRARLAERSAGAFTIAFMPGIIVTAVARAFGNKHPELDIDVLRTSSEDQVSVLHEGLADVSFIRMPASTRGLTVTHLFTEPRVVALPADHPLAAQVAVHIDELAGLHLLQHPDLVPEWRDIATELQGAESASDRVRMPALRSMEEKVEHVAGGRGIVVVPESAAAQYHRSDVVYRPVLGIAENRVSVAYSSERPRPELEEFARLASKIMTPVVPAPSATPKLARTNTAAV
jgi:DNA-binding transcriptional LysR family regulator